METNKEYLELVNEARNKQIKLTQQNYKDLKDIFKQASKELSIKSSSAKNKSLTKRFLQDYIKQLRKITKSISSESEKSIEDSIIKSANNATDIQLDFFNIIDEKYNLNLKESFTSMFSKVPIEAISEIISGNFYKDGTGLSKRIWWNEKKVNGDIDYIIQQGIEQKKSIYDLSKDLETYINPQAKKDWNWKNVYPGVGNKMVDYNAQRLARTSINHAYFLSNTRSCEANPFINVMHWELSLQHSIRMHGRTDICDTYANNDDGYGRGNFLIKNLPTPHPQCLCTQYGVVEDDLENIGTRLNAWVNGKPDKQLDDYLKGHK
ncbi:hypothetical protein [Clostridium scatologenes]|uniref:Uncharacterized protein n=1 Tax=Clostridium scatologenes TaxID=1548 RepID=A0A0E3JPB4_CLOSL|nr:hypothetical protein [Clostridium scatologenes]AKA70142.1 hypothetical protein CSCA_3017 [Clostridium scatologenes]